MNTNRRSIEFLIWVGAGAALIVGLFAASQPAAGSDEPSTTLVASAAPQVGAGTARTTPPAAPTTTTIPAATAPPPPPPRPASTAFSFPTLAPPTATTADCAGGYSSAELNAQLHDDPRGAGGIVGADYARVQRLPDGRVLWVFQDVFVGGDGSSLGTASFVHNAGLVQDGSCFHVVTGDGGGSWIGGAIEHPLHSWFWPLDSMMVSDGTLAQFMVEMTNPNGTGASDSARPVRVWIAKVRLTDFTVVELGPAPDSSDRPLYGFSITSDDRYDYLYGNCYRQFADPGWLGAHDVTCGPRVYVARVPLGHPEMAPEYWNGVTWSSLRQHAAAIMVRGAFANPMQVRRVGDMFVSVTKVDDWWGDSVTVDVARAPQGPWLEVTTLAVSTACGAKCNTYFAHLLPWTDADGALLVAISNNAWNMLADAYPDPVLYRPTILAVTMPAIVDVPFASATTDVESR